MKSLKDIKSLQKILKYYYIDDITQSEIAQKLNMSRIQVIRYIKYAKANNLIEVKLNIPLEEYFDLENTIETHFDLKECRVVPSFNNKRDFYKFASLELANILRRVLKKGMFVGVSWSQTIKNVLEYLDMEKKIQVNVMPVIGGLEIEGEKTNSNVIAHIFSEKIGGKSYSLNIPAVFDNREARNIMEKESHVIKARELANRIETLLVGVGNIGTDATIFKGGYFNANEINQLSSMGIVGSINLNFINNNGNVIKTYLNDRIIDIYPIERFKNINNIISVVFGSNKIKPLKAALKGKIIKYFITDENTARELI